MMTAEREDHQDPYQSLHDLWLFAAQKRELTLDMADLRELLVLFIDHHSFYSYLLTHLYTLHVCCRLCSCIIYCE